MKNRGITVHLFWAVLCGIGTYVAIKDTLYFAAFFTSFACIGNIIYATIKLIKNDNTQNN